LLSGACFCLFRKLAFGEFFDEFLEFHGRQARIFYAKVTKRSFVVGVWGLLAIRVAGNDFFEFLECGWIFPLSDNMLLPYLKIKCRSGNLLRKQIKSFFRRPPLLGLPPQERHQIQ